MTVKTRHLFLVSLLSFFSMLGVLKSGAAVPQVLNHQGRIAVAGVNFNGNGQFKFALVNANGSISYWSNDGTSTAGAAPSSPVTLTVTKGLYSVLLGDTALANMTALPTSALNHGDVRLRIWFNDGTRGFQQISPDQRLASTPYAFQADNALVAQQAVEAASFTGLLSGDVSGSQSSTSIANQTITGKSLTGFASSTGTLSQGDSILSALGKLHGNAALLAPLESPSFNGTVSGITASMVGLGNVSNTSDANKPVSTAQQAALDLKANLASPTFTGTVARPAGSTTAAPLRLTPGTNLTTATLGSVEFDGNNLYLTTNAASPTRKTVALSDTGSSSQLLLSNIVAAPVKPVVAWGSNSNGQTTTPSLSGVAAVAAGAYHSIALLDAGTVVAWGLNTSDQTIVPATATGVTDIAAGVDHNLARKSNGTIVAWGNNTYGQCTIPANITTATKVAAGKDYSLALLANGTLRAWGDNTWGQTTIPSSLTGVTVTAIASGEDHNLALTAAGAVVAWGRNTVGQVTVPTAATTGVIAIAAGDHHSLALMSNGTVVAWGWNEAGQCNVPADLSGVTQIAAGYGFSMALKSNGTPVVWGETADELPTIPDTATEVTAIAAGARHALALRSDLTPAQVARLDHNNVFSRKVTIQGTPGTYALEVNGTAWKSTGSSWLTNSDRRIKTDIESISGALDKLDQVRLVDFRYHQDYLASHPEIEDRRYPNVIAQEFAQVFPDDVKGSGQKLPDGTEILQVDTYPLTIYSAAAIQELHQENTLLKKRLSDQESRIRKLEALIENR